MALRFSAKEIGALAALLTVCAVVAVAGIAMIFREPQPEGREAVYQLAEMLVGLAAGLLGGGSAGYALGKSDKTSIEKEN
jgi:Mn2+/Fe2+ NRAMP family transporter